MSMKGLQIFTHSLRQVTGNLRAAIKVSGLLYSVQFILAFALGNTLFADEAAVMAAMETGEFPWTTYLLVLAITLTTSIWIAVGWHRYVLKVEQPGLLPEFHADRFLGYFGKSLLIGLIVLPLAAILGTVASIVLAPLAQPATSLLFEVLIGLVVYLPVAVVALRLSAILPGVALEPNRSIKEGWAATTGETGQIAVVALLCGAMILFLGMPAAYLFGPTSVLSIVWQFCSGWFVTMVGVSILTTLYGHYIEKRPLM
jgi:hypothetical protein